MGEPGPPGDGLEGVGAAMLRRMPLSTAEAGLGGALNPGPPPTPPIPLTPVVDVVPAEVRGADAP